MEEKEKIGINEMLEIFDGLEVFTEILIDRLKDGFQVDDLMGVFAAVVADPKMKKAMTGLSNIGKEVTDLDLLEIKELTLRAFNFGFNIFYMFKK